MATIHGVAVFVLIFVWPFVLPLICVGVLARVRRERLIFAAGLLTLLAAATAAPLVYSVMISPYDEGLALASLSLYPASLVAMAGTLLARALVIWLRRRIER